MKDMKVADGTITVEVNPGAINKVKDNLLQAINIRNVRGLAVFFGFGEEKPFNLPSKEVLTTRTRKNAAFFATNYAVLAALVGVVTILMNPLFLFVLMCLAGFWFYGSSAGTDEQGQIIIMGRPVTPEQRKLGMTVISLVIIIVFGGSIFFSICTASVALATAHAVLRDCPIVRDEDELGFLTGEANKIDDTV
ncbi:hypothetical protein Poli38472_000633 [Pythium oligandrum]|uniref:PRA1 family protein n=1 Tax=Pythium oligandrum TaxID=41045 RepID=A0A8K1CC34_PYTOL|nr:hypothetical protein Poli38472_000633 [Pythium oligandrum]|eukprot:TMW60591.1 hypothetical protein Poli38472_000633 [Pythium oligandrum]